MRYKIAKQFPKGKEKADMRRNKNLVLLSHDHYNGLTLASLIKKGAPHSARLPNDVLGKLRYTLNKYEEAIEPHFLQEEEILFPAVEGRNSEIDHLIEEVLEEHCMMREIVSLLKKNIHPEDNLHAFGVALEKHIRKEERTLFQKIEEVLTNDELSGLGIKMSTLKKNPAREKS